ncbi:MAG: CcmD family protein [Ginsengibacter sp.]
MHRSFLCLLFIAAMLLLNVASFAQDKVEMADAMRSNGKIYVVVGVCITILIGLFIYVFSIDRKISRFEKNKE